MTAKFDKAVVDVIVGEYVAVAEDTYEARTAVVAELADRYDVTVNAIRGKLVAEGVYIKKVAEVSTATKRVDKEAIASAFEASLGVKIKSLRNMTGKDLELFWNKFVEASAVRDADEGKS